MRSPAESLAGQRRREGLWRAAALAALAAAMLIAAWRVLRVEAPRVPVVQVQLDSSPTVVTRDSLSALARAGRNVSWRGTLAPLAVMAEPVREPGMRWRIAAVGSEPLQVRDSLGPIDSLASAAALTLEPTRGAAQVLQGTTVAAVTPRDVAPPRRVLVLGRVGWEPRFIITALEEAGWSVDTRLALGREREVRQGDAALRVDRHDVAIITDSATANTNAAALARFVRAGGGLILAGEAAGASATSLRAIAGARVLRREEPDSRSFEGQEPTQALPLFALGGMSADASVLEERDGTAAIVARRVESGRVMQVGYGETWRWRMEGEGSAVEEHRAYWSRLAGLVARGEPRPAASAPVASAPVASAPVASAPVASAPVAGDAAPLAALVQALGPAATVALEGTGTELPFPVWLGPIILLALLAEWGSRRRRGAP